MRRLVVYPRWLHALSLALVVTFLASPSLRAQPLTFAADDYRRQPVVPFDWQLLQSSAETSFDRPNRFPLFQMPTGYVKGAVGLDLDDDTLPPELRVPFTSPRDDLNCLQLNVGTDNPYFDFRRHGDPGGVGFYRLQSQLQLLDSGRSGVNLALGAVTPAGRENDGVQSGPTIFSPALAYYQDLRDGTTIQAFVGNHLRANARSLGKVERNVRCGLEAQRPLPFSLFTNNADADPSVFFFVEALGRYKWYESDRGRQPTPLELLPGIHWRLSENWWISGGVSVPLAAPRPENKLWQITCSWSF